VAGASPGKSRLVPNRPFFISYSHRDEAFAQKIHSRLRAEGIAVWYAPEDVQAGKKIHEQIDKAIQDRDRLLLVLTKHSMASEWVTSEIRKARKAEIKDCERKLFPIRLVSFDVIREWECFDADSGKDLGVEIREYFIPDFSKWKQPDHFEAAFARLLKDLRASDTDA
jgi:TIR domain